MSTQREVLARTRAAAKQRGHKLGRWIKQGALFLAECTVCGRNVACHPPHDGAIGAALMRDCRVEDPSDPGRIPCREKGRP